MVRTQRERERWREKQRARVRDRQRDTAKQINQTRAILPYIHIPDITNQNNHNNKTIQTTKQIL